MLADEEVTAEGRSAVGNYPVYRRPLRQWMLRITAYAERLLADLDLVDWPERIKRLQRHWIGPSGGPYHLKDWLFSRQRYWGEPFPVVYDEAEPARPIALPDHMLPVTLPEMKDFRPAPQDDESDPVPALARAPGWAEVTLDLGDGPRRYRRELNVMPQWAGSCWYYLRYLEPGNDAPRPTETSGTGCPVRRRPVCRRRGARGAAPAVRQVLAEGALRSGVASTPEPFGTCLTRDISWPTALPMPAAGRARRGGDPHGPRLGIRRPAGHPAVRENGKSLKNGVSPDAISRRLRRGHLRLYEMAMGPLDGDWPWRADGITGITGFLQRVWRLVIDESTGEPLTGPGLIPAPDAATARLLHQTIAAVREDFAVLRFHAAIAPSSS